MEETGEINSKVANSISLSLLSRYFKPLRDMPRSGVKEGACVYGGSIGVETAKIIVMIGGRDLNIYGESTEKGIRGFEEALLDALVRQYPAKKSETCSIYRCKGEKKAVQKVVAVKIEEKERDASKINSFTGEREFVKNGEEVWTDSPSANVPTP